MIRDLRLTPLHIPFKVAFRHASAERTETSSLLAEALSDRGTVGCGESCPRPYVTGETLDTAVLFFQAHEAGLRADVVDLDTLRTWMAARGSELDANPAAWCAVELAILDLLARESGRTIEAFLSLPPLGARFAYTAVVGDAGPEAFRAIAEQYRRQGFGDFKLKLSGDLEKDQKKLATMRAWDVPIRIRVDANNLWTTADEAIGFLRALDYPFFAVEEPIPPNQYADLARIADALSCRIVLDESLLRIAQMAALEGSPTTWLINVRVSKMGGLLRSLAVVEAARAAGIGLIVGAQVGETSLLTRAGITVAHASGDALVAQEGAFGTHLLERDVCDPPLMFGAGGVLDTARYPSLARPGLGFERIG